VAYINSTELGRLSALPAAIIARIDSATVTAAIDAACATADGYLASRYEFPFTQPGTDLKQACADIAGYRLASTHGYSNDGDDSDIRTRYEDAIAWLRDVSKGLVTLDKVTQSPAPVRFARVVSPNTVRGW
jgi:phage gp36-like protein